MDSNPTLTFERAQSLAEELQRLNQSSPVPRPHQNPNEEIINWNLQTLRPDKMSLPAKSMLSSSDAHCCKTPFEELKSIKLREMEVPKVHLGRYLVCKAVGKPVAEIGAYTLIQDFNGGVQQVAFYNFSYNLDDVDWLSPGTVLIIKEPWLQYARNKCISLRIDSPSDVVFVDPADEGFLGKIGAMQWYEQVSKDAEVWRQKGNECFKAGKYEKAIFFYDRGIRCDPDMAVLYLNKALTCLKIDAFYAAYEAAKLGLEKGGDKEKALYRMGQAAYGMREWQKAANHFVELLKDYPGHPAASEQLKRATTRLAEQRNGKYNLKMTYLESQKAKPEMDVADYTGPIEIANIPEKGRGIIATKDIQKGTLLVLSKAFGSGHGQDFPQSLYTRANIVDEDPRCMTQALQFIATIQTLKNNPQKTKEIYDLYAGDTVTKEEISDGIIDVARLEKICVLNRFGSRASETQNYCDLHIMPTYFNHSCLANAHTTVYETVMAIHATTDIKKGEEIFLAYISGSEAYSVRKKKFESWNFVCKCKLCQIDSKDELCYKRNQIFEEFCEFVERNQNSPNAVIAKGEETLKKIRETYSKRKEYKIVLAQMLYKLYAFYCAVNSPKALKCLEEIVTFVEDSLSYAFDMALIYFALGNWYFAFVKFGKSDEMMQKALKLSFCTDIEHLEMRYRLKPLYILLWSSVICFSLN